MAVSNPDEKVFKPQPGPQTLLLACPYRDIFIGGARGGGKSWGVGLYMAAHGERYGKDAYMIVFRKTYKELEDFNEKKLKEILPALGWHYSSGKQHWNHPNGATIVLGYLQHDGDSAKYQGHEYTLMVFEEIGNYKKPDEIDMLRGSLRSAAGVPTVFLATGNPGGIGHEWLKERYIDPAPPLTPFKCPVTGITRIFIPARLEDNRLLQENDPDYESNLKASGGEMLYRAWRYGDWTISREGKVFMREWWQYYNWSPYHAVMPRIGLVTEIPEILYIVQSWDTGFKVKTHNDPSACVTIGVGRTAYYILDCWNRHVEFPELERTLTMLANKWRAKSILIEDKASGQTLLQTLKRNTALPIKGIVPDQDKLARANAITPLVEAGKILLPKNEPWVADFVEELSSFPEGTHDDIVDALSQGINRVAYVRAREEKYEQRRARKTSHISIYGR